MKTYRVSKAAELIGVSASTLRRYTSEGRINDTRNPAGQRVYTMESIDKFLGRDTTMVNLVFYVRSSDGDQAKMDNQVRLLTEKYGEPTRVIKDRASGLNEKRPGLISLLNHVEKGHITHIAITQKDRLTRFGYSYLERLIESNHVELLVLGEIAPKAPHGELLQDFMSLLASFSGKFYRLRGYEQQEQLLTTAGEELEEKRTNH